MISSPPFHFYLIKHHLLLKVQLHCYLLQEVFLGRTERKNILPLVADSGSLFLKGPTEPITRWGRPADGTMVRSCAVRLLPEPNLHDLRDPVCG